MMKVSKAALREIQKHFHEVILGRICQMTPPPRNLSLPTLDETTPTSGAKPAWLPVPGMHGGFSYWFDLAGEHPKLITESWSRVCGGSGQRHEIDASGSQLTAEGFV